MDDWLTIALAVGLCARITRLITLDTITAPIRDRLPGLLGALVQCAWCTGVWAAVPVGLSWYWWAAHDWWQVTAVIGTAAWVAGAVSNAAMPSQHEVATVAPVALINADEPAPEPQLNGTGPSISTAEVEQIVVRALERARTEATGEAASEAGD